MRNQNFSGVSRSSVQAVVANAARALMDATGNTSVDTISHNEFIQFLYLTNPSAVLLNVRTVERCLRRFCHKPTPTVSAT